MPTGMKFAIGCIVLFFGVGALMTAVLGVGGFWLKGKADQLVEGVEERVEVQREAADILARLAREHPFTAPADGRIDPGSAERFFEATSIAWQDIEPVARRLNEVAERHEAGDVRVGDIGEGLRASSAIADSRLHIARALDEVDMSLAEYTWTGGNLQSAWKDANLSEAYQPGIDADPVLSANIEVARRHAGPLAAMAYEVEELNPSAVLHLAQMWTRELPPL